ncbi:GvpL/GvpF family gas vesicle protein [Streptomyces griseocarneus]|uniref:GvpL/GvpF family gas vesicle protein n=1 Tax=Streptomyces griseocarneus TaxID=51201 RepID=UPI0019A34FEC|nr:GvpL/GvpF family gas vesicle protein [Streptomyces griseocarneus]MBZ6475738.1 GvpL/GvpF family gas vesicle protein [Streptomyces griseocarneus]GHG51047.1 gas vesicle protein [Streptomyces griseocarneus]
MNPTQARYLYAYAVVRASDAVAGALETVTGVADGPVRAVRHGDLMVLAGPVPATDHGERQLAEHLEDLDWLERTARAHQRVIGAAAAVAPSVLPLRLATVFHDEEGARAMLGARHDTLLAALDRLDGRTEWGVKIYALGTARPAGTVAVPPPDAPRAAVSGRDYLRRRAAERHAAQEGVRREDEAARGIHTTLTALAQETRLHPPQNPRLSGQAGRNVLNAAYLVRREDGPRFTSAVAQLAERAPRDGMRVDLTGPWAPYSFAGTDASPESP